MSEREPRLIIIDILNAVNDILEFTANMEFEAFRLDKKTVAACERNFEIMGEASKQLPESFIQNHHEMEWHKMVSFRNLIIHEYFRLELQIEWNIIIDFLPKLKEKLEVLLKELIK